MGAEVQVQSNLFLPFGKVRMGLKVRMGYLLGRLGWVILWRRLGWVLEREGAEDNAPCPIWIKSNEDTGRCHLHREWTTIQNGLIADIAFTCLPPSCRLRCKCLVGVSESLSGSCSCL